MTKATRATRVTPGPLGLEAPRGKTVPTAAMVVTGQMALWVEEVLLGLTAETGRTEPPASEDREESPAQLSFGPPSSATRLDSA